MTGFLKPPRYAMTDPMGDYMLLIRSFLRREITFDEFQGRYLKQLRDESQLGCPARVIVDELSNQVGVLLRDPTSHPDLSIQSLGRNQAKIALGRLEALNRRAGS
jgi:hypothetical protein